MRTTKLRILAVLSAVALGLPLASRGEGSATSPSQPGTETAGTSAESVVESLHEVLLAIMKDAEQLGYQGRYDRLARILPRTFDLGFMARKSVGRHWRILGEEEQRRWLDTFERYTIANYAGRFKDYSGQHFETIGVKPAAHETTVVHTRLVQPNDEDVELNYRLRAVDGGWQIIDVYLNGTVSELALRRSEYSSAIKRDGFEALVASVDRKVADLAAGTESD